MQKVSFLYIRYDTIRTYMVSVFLAWACLVLHGYWDSIGMGMGMGWIEKQRVMHMHDSFGLEHSPGWVCDDGMVDGFERKYTMRMRDRKIKILQTTSLPIHKRECIACFS